MEMFLYVFLAIVGIFAHFLKKLAEGNRAGKDLRWGSYWADHPYEVGLSIVGTVILFAIAWEMEELGVISAVMSGYVGNSFGDVLGNRQKGM